MPESAHLPIDEVQPPHGTASYLWFGGIVEGPRRDPSLDVKLRAVTSGINQLRLGQADLELDGGRFSILLNDETIPGERADNAKREQFLALLQDLQDSVADAGVLESTLRCTEVFAEKTVESLFAPVGQQMRSVSRVREITAEDRRHAPAQQVKTSELAKMGKKKAIAILLLLVVTLSLYTWQTGLIDKIFAESGSQLEVEMSGLGRILTVEVSSSWGNYVIEIRRGESFPVNTQEREALLAATTDLAEQALLRTVVDGGTIYARIEDEENKVLRAQVLDLRPLLSIGIGIGNGDTDKKVVVKLPGMIRAWKLRLALDSGLENR